MNVKLLLAGLVNSMLQDHVGPIELIDAIGDLASQIGQKIDMTVWGHAVQKISNSSDPKVIEAVNLQIEAFKINMLKTGLEKEMLHSHLLSSLTKDAVNSNVTEEQYIELIRTAYKTALEKQKI